MVYKKYTPFTLQEKDLTAVKEMCKNNASAGRSSTKTFRCLNSGLILKFQGKNVNPTFENSKAVCDVFVERDGLVLPVNEDVESIVRQNRFIEIEN